MPGRPRRARAHLFQRPDERVAVLVEFGLQRDDEPSDRPRQPMDRAFAELRTAWPKDCSELHDGGLPDDLETKTKQPPPSGSQAEGPLTPQGVVAGRQVRALVGATVVLGEFHREQRHDRDAYVYVYVCRYIHIPYVHIHI